ncbi:MAG: Gfo/Idh/MocA family protein [Sphaerochaetaceae bacterium]
MKQRISVGCIGAGNIFTHAHLPIYVELEKTELVAIYDIDVHAAERAKSKYEQACQAKGKTLSREIVICSSPEELFSLVDLVDVCTSVRYHAWYSALALQHNVHAMTEKPMARTWLEAQAVVESQKNSTALFQLNDDNIFIPRYLTMRNIVESGVLGTIQDIKLARGTCSSERAAWFWDPLESGGGSIMDYGSHAIYASWFILGFEKEPVEVCSLGIRTKEPTRIINAQMQHITIDDDAHFKIMYRDPNTNDWATICIEATWAIPDFAEVTSDVHGYVEIRGSEGYAISYMDDEENEFIKIGNAFGERLIPVQSVASEEYSFRAEIENFLARIEDPVSDKAFFDTAVAAKTIKIINGAQLSELLGRKSVSMHALETYTGEITSKKETPWDKGDILSVALGSCTIRGNNV